MDTIAIALDKENNMFVEMDSNEQTGMNCKLWENPELTPEEADKLIPF